MVTLKVLITENKISKRYTNIRDFSDSNIKWCNKCWWDLIDNKEEQRDKVMITMVTTVIDFEDMI